MKLTNAQLKQIIKEELRSVLKEHRAALNPSDSPAEGWEELPKTDVEIENFYKVLETANKDPRSEKARYFSGGKGVSNVEGGEIQATVKLGKHDGAEAVFVNLQWRKNNGETESLTSGIWYLENNYKGLRDAIDWIRERFRLYTTPADPPPKAPSLEELIAISINSDDEEGPWEGRI